MPQKKYDKINAIDKIFYLFGLIIRATAATTVTVEAAVGLNVYKTARAEKAAATGASLAKAAAALVWLVAVAARPAAVVTV